MTRVGRQNGYILLPVVLFITVIATIAFLINNDTTINTDMTGAAIEAEKVQQVARAGLAHAVWGAQNSGCVGDLSMTTVPFGQGGIGSYTATITTPGGTTTDYPNLPADQDAWIRSDDITKKNGSTPSNHLRMESGNLEYAVVRFDLSTLPAGAQINTAVARFYVKSNSGHPEGPVTVHRATADWAEADATWETMGDKFDNAALYTIPAQPAAGDDWVTVNLTAQVQAWVNGGEPNYGIMLIPTGEGTHAEYMSRDGGANTRSRLDVIVGNGPASPMTITATGTLTGNPSPANDISRTLTRTDEPAYQPPGTVILQLGTDPGADTLIDSFYPRNYGGADYLQVNGNPSWLQRLLLKFDLGGVPARASVLSARLELSVMSVAAPGMATVHRVTRSWVGGSKTGGGTADGATWATYDGNNNWTSTGGDFNASATAEGAIDSSATWVTWEIAPLVEQWLIGVPNNGLLIQGDGALREAKFAAKENTNDAVQPKLTITYACECGSACLAPQGSGNVLMVVYDKDSMHPVDLAKKAMLESWGYAVNLISGWDVDWDFDTQAANNDVVYVSETVDATTLSLAPKLASASIGVVNEDGWLNDELGFESANSSNWPVGDSIAITDNSHYITALFPAGPLTIYDGNMGGLAIDNTPAPDLQSLADWGTDTGLAVLESGAMTAGGSPTAGRRVMLPFGRAPNMNWPHVNNNGLLILQRALQWGMGNTGAPPKNLLLVTSGSSPTAQEQLRIDLIESWGYAVNTIDDDDSQANFDAAIAANDVAYIPQDINSTSLGTKMTNATIGVVNEEGEQVDELGFSETKLFKSNHEIDVIDNSHYITQPFATGFLTFVSSDRSVHMLSGWISPGLQTLGQTFNTGSQYKPSLATLDAGDELFGGGSAAGRRVELPWGGGTFDINLLTDDGRTIMRRAVEWGAGSGGIDFIGHWKLDDGAGTVAGDSSGRGNDGTLTNGPLWVAGMLADALDFDGIDDRVRVPDAASLDITDNITLAAWIRPNKIGTQYVIRKAQFDSTDGYELSLSTTGKVFFRLNQASNANTYRIDSTTSYPNNGSTWMHIAATYDGSVMRLYLNGVEDATLTATTNIATNDTDLSIGAQVDGTRGIDGVIDDARLYGEALSAAEIAGLAGGGSSPQTILLVVGDAVTLSSKDAGRKALMEAWGYTVPLIDDGDSQANFDTAAAAADVVYVSGTIVGGSLADKLTGSTTPIVNEFPGKLDNFGFCSVTTDQFSADTFSKSDASHDISSPFGGSSINILTTFMTMPVPSGTLAPDLQVPANFTDFESGIVALDIGGTRWDGNPAPARRVHLPFGNAGIDQLTADGRELMKRSIDWAGGASGGGGGPSIEPPGTCNGTYRDEFNLQQYDQNDGSLSWATSWTETGETTSPTGGDIRITSENDTYELTVRDDGQTVWREADLSQAGAATLSFDYWRRDLSGSADYVAVEVSYNGGSSWTELDRFTGTANDGAFTSTSYVLDAGSLSANTRIRFLTPSSGMSNSNQVLFDNIQIECSP